MTIKKHWKTTHGMKYTRFYETWHGMKGRCTVQTLQNYKNYGGRGIKVCTRWIKFENFRDDMYESYLKHAKEFGEKNTLIDRIDSNGNYEPSNCKWATPLEQSNNTCKVHYILFNGERKSISAWARQLGIKRTTLRNRVNKLNWNIEKALNV